MAEIVIRLDFRPGARWQRLALAGALLLLSAPELGSESVTLATYYPAPSGVYTNMITTGNTYLARDGGNLGVGTPNPQSKVHVNSGNVMVTNGHFGMGDPGMTIGAGMPAPAAGVFMIDLKWNGVLRIGRGMLSSGGDAVRLANNAYHDGNGWRGDNAGTPGAVVELSGQSLNVYSHNGAGGMTTNAVIDAAGLSLPGKLTVDASRSDLAGHMIVRGQGSCNWSHARTFPVNGYTPCPANTYATMQSGVITKYTMMPRYADVTTSNANAWMLCCPCPSGGCPSL